MVSRAPELAVREEPKRRILVVFNPAAGRNRRAKLNRVLNALKTQAEIVAVTETNAPGHAEFIARNADEGRIDLIAAAGGDGTINEIVNGLRGKDIALGLIPLGTANVLADEIGLRRGARAVARTLASGPLRAIHVGEANGRRFTMMAGAGFDADVVDAVSLPLKKKLGPLAYVWQTAKQAFTDSFAGCEVVVDGTSHRTTSAVICNGRHYGGPFVAAPQATVTDDLLHVILLKGRGWLSVLRYSAALLAGHLHRLNDVEIIAGRKISVAAQGARPVQADGDIITALPLQVGIDPERVRLAFPA
jgi:YegS/Rv2252/BmrU family lipid kinase